MKKNMDFGFFLVRIAIGFPMLVYGISKLFSGVGFIETMLTEKGLPGFLAYGVYLGEVVAPILIIAGFRTRIAGVVFAINCLTAILLAQTDAIFARNPYGGWALELLFIYMVCGISLFFTGAGRWAISAHHKWD
jgi:putative oxidoreductase